MKWHLFEVTRANGRILAAVDAKTREDALKRLQADDPLWSDPSVVLVGICEPKHDGLLFWWRPKD